jgi:type II secretory pathway pseudopilin PulG
MKLIIKNNKKYSAFTLAEVLITLLVIGVVSSLVIPALINDSKDAEFEVAYKKAFADATNVTKQALANSELTSKITAVEADVTLANWNVFKSYFSVSKDCQNNNNSSCWDHAGEKININDRPRESENAFVDNAGRAWSEYGYNENIILVDTNGFKAPNRYGKDRWTFTQADQNNVRISSGLPTKVLPFYNIDITTTHAWCHYPPCYFKSWLFQ